MNKKDADYPEVAILAGELRAQIVKLRRRLREQAVTGNLTSSQIAVILRLDLVGSATVSELSRLEGVRPQSMRNTVLSLKDTGYVKGRDDPGDGRKTFISLTEKGHKLLRDGRTVLNDWLASRISAKLNRDEQNLLHDAVKLIERLTME